MKFCADHWSKLRTTIFSLGMESLVAKSGEEAINRTIAEIESGEITKSNFDPLMAAHWAITGRALEKIGLYLMGTNEDGSERCPLCECQKAHLASCGDPECKYDVGDAWIKGCSESMLEEAKKLSLIGEA